MDDRVELRVGELRTGELALLFLWPLAVVVPAAAFAWIIRRRRA